MDTQQPKPEFFLVPKRHPKKAVPAGLCPSLLHAGLADPANPQPGCFRGQTGRFR
jgi:hypothetical protein